MVGMTLMELGDSLHRVREVCQGRPGALVRSIALPINEIFQLSMPNVSVQDFFHFPFHVVVDPHGRGWRLYSARETVLPVRF